MPTDEHDRLRKEHAKRRKAAKARAERERMRKAIYGVTFTEHLLKIADHLKVIERDVEQAIPCAHLADSFGRKAIERIASVHELLGELIERSRAAPMAIKDITPGVKRLTLVPASR